MMGLDLLQTTIAIQYCATAAAAAAGDKRAIGEAGTRGSDRRQRRRLSPASVRLTSVSQRRTVRPNEGHVSVPMSRRIRQHQLRNQSVKRQLL
jgi:hypothetical protein